MHDKEELTEEQKAVTKKYAGIKYRKLRAKNPYIDEFVKKMNLSLDYEKEFKNLVKNSNK